MNSPFLLRHAVADITPVMPCRLAGYDNRPFPFDSVSDRLEANILQLTHEGKRILLISLDTFFVTRQFKLQLISALGKAGMKLDEEEVFLIASHTHFSPNLDPAKPVLGNAEPAYVQFTMEKIAEAVTAMCAGKEERVHVSLHEKETRLTINRRRKIIYREGLRLRKKISIGPNYKDPASGKITVLRFTNGQGEVKAIAWHFACHPTDFYRHNSVSAGYIGMVRGAVRKSYGNIPVVFLQGFAGNVKPLMKQEKRSLAGKIKDALLLPESFPALTKELFTGWAELLSRHVQETASGKAELQLTPRITSTLIERSLRDFFDDDSHRTMTFQETRLGDELSLIAVSAEPVIEYEAMVQRLYGKHRVLCCGYTDNVYIYLPTARQLSEGGYECEGFREKFSITGSFNPGIEKNVADAFRVLKEKTKGK